MIKVILNLKENILIGEKNGKWKECYNNGVLKFEGKKLNLKRHLKILFN